MADGRCRRSYTQGAPEGRRRRQGQGAALHVQPVRVHRRKVGDLESAAGEGRQEGGSARVPGRERADAADGDLPGRLGNRRRRQGHRHALRLGEAHRFVGQEEEAAAADPDVHLGNESGPRRVPGLSQEHQRQVHVVQAGRHAGTSDRQHHPRGGARRSEGAGPEPDVALDCWGERSMSCARETA